MTILVTNDDGVEAPGIQRLHKELRRLGRTVVVAPDREQSASSHALTLRYPLHVERVDEDVYHVNGTPTDCVMVAVRGLLGERPEVLVSGINHGANLGDDVTYSGTVAAAMEGTILGIPSVAISLAHPDPPLHFDLAARLAACLVETIMKQGLPRETLLNVNVPNLPDREIAGIEVTRLGKRVYQDNVERQVDPQGRVSYLIGGGEPTGEVGKGTDFWAIDERRVSITPLHLDLTNYRALAEIMAWDIRGCLL